MSASKGLRRVVDALQGTLFDGRDVPAAAPPPGEQWMWLCGERVGWKLRRSRRRTIGFVVGEQGLVVSAPMRTPIREIEAAIGERGRWVISALSEQRERALRLASSRIEWRDGGSIRYLGAPLRLRLDPDAGTGVAYRPAIAGQVPAQIVIGLSRDAPPEALRDSAKGWLRGRALARFESRSRHYAPALGVRYTKVSLSSAATRWGSASANGNIRLHWRLIELAPETIDYVVVHELAHLREMNHGPKFWRLVGSVIADHERLRKRLHETELPPGF